MGNAQLKAAHDKTRLALLAAYEIWPVGVEQMSTGAKPIAEKAGITVTPALNALKLFEELGILSRRMSYNYNDIAGRHWHYTLLMSPQKAQDLLDTVLYMRIDEHAKNVAEGARRSAQAKKGKPMPRKNKDNGIAVDVQETFEAVTVAKRDSEEVRAIAGPEGESTIATKIRAVRLPDDAAALIEAARQYANRESAIADSIARFEKTAAEMGFTFDREQMLASIVMEPDERLDAIVPLLPYITALEERVERRGEQIVELREKLKGYDEMNADNARLKRQVERLVAANVAHSQASQ